MDKLSGIVLKNGERMRHWNALVEEWSLAHERFARLRPNDPAYWYGERPNIGVLSGAAWRCGLIAIEEFAMTKSASTIDESGAKSWRGRCDLWIGHDSYEEFIEAKHISVEIDAVAHSRIRSALQEAIRDSVASYISGYCTALVFVSIRSQEKPSQIPEFSNRLQSLLDQLGGLDAEMLAWCFPSQTRDLLGPAGKYYWPGIIMLSRSVQTSPPTSNLRNS